MEARKQSKCVLSFFRLSEACADITIRFLAMILAADRQLYGDSPEIDALGKPSIVPERQKSPISDDDDEEEEDNED